MRRFFVVITCAAALAIGSVALANNQTVADNIEQALVQSAALEEADQIQVMNMFIGHSTCQRTRTLIHQSKKQWLIVMRASVTIWCLRVIHI